MPSVVDDKVRCPAAYRGDFCFYGWGDENHQFQWIGCRNSVNTCMNVKVQQCLLRREMDRAKKVAGFFQCIQSVENYAKCVWCIEDHLDLQSRSVIHTSNLPDVVFVEPGMFWYAVPTRLSFFTIWARAVARAAAQMKTGEASPPLPVILSKDDYFKQSAEATALFCDRCTYYDSFEAYGWLDVFRSMGRKPAERLLHDPRKFTHEVWLKKVQAKADQLVVLDTKKKQTLDDHWRQAEHLCSLAACIG